MIQIFTKQDDKKLSEIPYVKGAKMSFIDKWIHLSNPTDQEIEYISRSTGIDENMIKAALDEEERARIESEDSNVMVLFDVPYIEEDEKDNYFTYNTIPLAVIIAKTCIVTICLKNTSVINDFVHGRIKTFSLAKRFRFLLQILYNAHIKYLKYLKQLDRSSKRIQTELHRSMKNSELIQLLELENSLVYFSTSLKANNTVIEKLIRIEALNISDDDKELLEDVAVENKQAIETCTIYRDILSGTMDAFASVISNNLNIVMKLLTYVTVILSIPTLVFSLWGVNTGVPFGGQNWGFYVVIGIAAIPTVLFGLFLTKKNFADSDRAKKKNRKNR